MTAAERLAAIATHTTVPDIVGDSVTSAVNAGVAAMVRRERGTSDAALAGELAGCLVRYAPVETCRIVFQLPGLAAVHANATGAGRRRRHDTTNASELLSLDGATVGTVTFDGLPTALVDAGFLAEVGEAIGDVLARHAERNAGRARTVTGDVIELIDGLYAGFTDKRLRAIVACLADLPGATGVTLSMSTTDTSGVQDGLADETARFESGQRGPIMSVCELRRGMTLVVLEVFHAAPPSADQLDGIDAVAESLDAAVMSVATGSPA